MTGPEHYAAAEQTPADAVQGPGEVFRLEVLRRDLEHGTQWRAVGEFMPAGFANSAPDLIEDVRRLISRAQSGGDTGEDGGWASEAAVYPAPFDYACPCCAVDIAEDDPVVWVKVDAAEPGGTRTLRWPLCEGCGPHGFPYKWHPVGARG